MNTNPASQKQIDYINSLIAQAIDTLESELRTRETMPPQTEKSLITTARFQAELAFWALMDVESAGLNVSEASELIDLIKNGMGIVTLMGYRESSFVALMNSDQMTPLIEKILSSMIEGVEVDATPVEQVQETMYEVVAEGFEHSINPYSVVLNMINEYAEDARKFDDRSRYEVHEETTWQRYSPNPQWLHEIWIDDQCIAREVVDGE